MAAEKAAPYCQHENDPILGGSSSFCVSVVSPRHDDRPGPAPPRFGLDGETSPERHGRTEEVLFRRAELLSAEVEVGARGETSSTAVNRSQLLVKCRAVATSSRRQGRFDACRTANFSISCSVRALSSRSRIRPNVKIVRTVVSHV